MAEIEYRAKSTEGKVRHPLFKGLREEVETKMIIPEIDTVLVSDQIEQFLNKLVEAEPMTGTPQFDKLMAEADALYDKLSDEKRLWFDEQAEAIGKPIDELR